MQGQPRRHGHACIHTLPLSVTFRQEYSFMTTGMHLIVVLQPAFLLWPRSDGGTDLLLHTAQLYSSPCLSFVVFHSHSRQMSRLYFPFHIISNSAFTTQPTVLRCGAWDTECRRIKYTKSKQFLVRNWKLFADNTEFTCYRFSATTTKAEGRQISC
jgi:hypothetical protein